MKIPGQLFVIAAPSGAGKTSLVSALVQDISNVCVSISHTTRPKRPREQHGVDYFFVDVAEFKHMIEQNLFLEYALVFGNYYGTSHAFVEQKLSEGTDVILEIDWQGAAQIRKRLPQSRSIFILPPSPESLRQRLQARDQDDPHVIETRLENAALEMSHHAEFDYLVVNENFDMARLQLEAILGAERLRMDRQKARYEQLIHQLI